MKSDIKTNLKLEISLPVHSNLDKSLKHLSSSTRNKTDLISPQSKSLGPNLEVFLLKYFLDVLDSVDLCIRLEDCSEVFYVVCPFPGFDGGLNYTWEVIKS